MCEDMLYNSLAISITNKCNASCKFCGVSACNSNSKEKSLEKEVLEKICKEVIEIESIKNIVFTGGEAFLYFNRIKSIIPLLKKGGKNVGIVTNGFIFKNMQTAEKMLNEIKNSGFSFLHISTDQYHLEYIDLNTIKNAILICKQNRIDVTLKIGMQRFDTTYVKIIEELDENIFNTSIQFYPIMPIGRATSLTEEKFFSKPVADLNLSCKHFTTLFIDERGDIYPCCFFKRPKSMILGNVRTNSIKEAISLARKNKCYKEIYLCGFNKLVDNLIRNRIISLEDKYVDVCHLCNAIFGDIKYRNVLENYYLDK